METTTQDLSNFTRPIGFYIRGFYAVKNPEYYFILLAVIYVITVLANFTLMCIIWFAEALHTPKYMAVFSLAIVDVSLTTAVVPKAIHIFLFDSKFVYFSPCLTQMFFVHYFASMEAMSLCVLAYDRLVAICFPLRSNTLNTNSTMMRIIFMCWCIPLTADIVMVLLIRRLPYCKSAIVNTYFCDHGPMFRIACGDTTPNLTMGFVITIVLTFVPFTFIVLTYVFIIRAILKRSSGSRWKAFKTCTSHIMLVAIYFIPFLVNHVIALANVPIDADTRITNTSLAVCIPPFVNPIIYSLKSQEIVEQIKKFLSRRKTIPK